jgi:hypothetical protein
LREYVVISFDTSQPFDDVIKQKILDVIKPFGRKVPILLYNFPSTKQSLEMGLDATIPQFIDSVFELRITYYNPELKGSDLMMLTKSMISKNLKPYIIGEITGNVIDEFNAYAAAGIEAIRIPLVDEPIEEVATEEDPK